MVESNKMLNIDNPNNVTIEISHGTSFLEIDVTQGIHLRLEENKKPIYGYNERSYSKVLSGKAIASGSIVIKKHAKESILTKLKSKAQDSLKLSIAKSLSTKFDTIYEILNNQTASQDFLTITELHESELDDTILSRQLLKFGGDTLQEEIANRVEQVRDQSKDDLTFDQLLKASSISIRIKFGDDSFNVLTDEETNAISLNDSGSYYVNLRDVSFLSKETTISVGQTSIDEVYTFMANLD